MNKFFLLCLLSIIGFSQNNITSQDKTYLSDNLKNYYLHINNAEKGIIKDNFQYASAEYDSAFIFYDKPHVIDLYNALITKIEIIDYKSALKIYKLLERFNFDFDKNLKEDIKYINFLKYYNSEMVDNIEKPYEKNTILMETLKKMVEKDQFFRKLSNGNYSKFKDSISKYDILNSIKLKQIIDDYDFPNEYDIGINNRTKYVDYQDFYYIIWHQNYNSNIGCQTVNFTNYLFDAIYKGKIRPQYAVDLINLNSSDVFIPEIQLVCFTKRGEAVSNTYYLNKKYLDVINKSELNENLKKENLLREKIGLCSVQDEINKLFFCINNKKFILKNKIFFNFEYEEEKEILKFKESFIKVDINDFIN